MSRSRRIIKKYANRRLYDTESSQSINLEDVRDMIGTGDSIKVVEAKSGNDVTRQVLLQIVADQEMLGRPVLSDDFLEAMIRVNSNPMRDMARDYLERVMTLLQTQQQPLEKAFSETLGEDGLGTASLEPYRKLQERMFSLWTEALKPTIRRNEPDGDT